MMSRCGGNRMTRESETALSMLTGGPKSRGKLDCFEGAGTLLDVTRWFTGLAREPPMDEARLLW